tara:strand:+ start:318 stop:572 length:255 start_codon:yes stop_codon:yes gene_type:complete
MKATQHARLNRWGFEQKLSTLLEQNGLLAGQQLYREKHYERSFNEDDEEQYTLLWLYYNDAGHIGTWCKQKCWVFEDNLKTKEK